MNGTQYNSTTAYGVINLPVVMRAAPSLEQVTGTNYFVSFGNGKSFLYLIQDLSKTKLPSISTCVSDPEI